MSDIVEFYDARDRQRRIACVNSSIVPKVGEFINVRRETWSVKMVTYSLDYVGVGSTPTMRAIVDLKRRPEYDPK